MNTRQKELLCKAIEQGATCWMSVKGEVCCAWMAGDNTALDFWNDCYVNDGAVMQRLSISGTEQDVVSF